MEDNSVVREKLEVGGDFSNYDDDGDSRKLLVNDEITPDWPQYFNIRKRYCVALLLFLFSFLDVHANKSTWDAVISSDYSYLQHYHMDTAGIAVACVCGFWIHRIGGATFIGVGNLGKAVVASTFYSVVKGEVYPAFVHSFTFGFFRGLSSLGIVDVLAHWAPPNERVRLTTLVSLGNGLSYVTYDILVQDTWRNNYHAAGVVLFSWSILWILFVSNDPTTDRYITKRERNYLRETINFECIRGEQVGLILRRILTSPPVYVLILQFCVYHALFILSMAMPVKLNIRETWYTGSELWLVATIDLVPLMAKALGACFLDYLRCKPTGYTVDRIHKTLLFWSPLGTLVFFFLTVIFTSNNVRIICILLGRICYELSSTSYAVILIDMAGPYAGSLKSVVTLVRLAINTFLYRMITTGNDLNISLMLKTGIFTMLVTFTFITYGSGDLQPWARTPQKKEVSDTAGKTNQGERDNHSVISLA